MALPYGDSIPFFRRSGYRKWKVFVCDRRGNRGRLRLYSVREIWYTVSERHMAEYCVYLPRFLPESPVRRGEIRRNCRDRRWNAHAEKCAGISGGHGGASGRQDSLCRRARRGDLWGAGGAVPAAGLLAGPAGPGQRDAHRHSGRPVRQQPRGLYGGPPVRLLLCAPGPPDAPAAFGIHPRAVGVAGGPLR